MSTKTDLASSIQQYISSKNIFGYGSCCKRNEKVVAITQAIFSLRDKCSQRSWKMAVVWVHKNGADGCVINGGR